MVLFFVVTFLAAWAFFVPVAATMSAADPAPTILVTLGAFTPALVAIGLTWRAAGRAGMHAWLVRLFEPRVGLRWYVFAASYMLVVKLVVAVVHRAVWGEWPRFGDALWLIPVAIVTSTLFQAGEEIGWRGYALPRLASRFGLAPASLLLGVIWATWHLPLFYIRGAETYAQSFFVFTLGVIAISVAMAWLYARTNGNLLPLMVLHAAVNNAKDIVPSVVPGAAGVDTFGMSASPVAWFTVAVLWIFAGYCLKKISGGVRLP